MPEERGVVIRTMTEADVPEVVTVHLASFPTFFLSFLGRRFLRLLYSATLTEPEALAFVSIDGSGRITGFVTGVTRQGAFYSRLVRRDKWRFAFAAAGAALRKPSIVPRLLRALRRPSEASESSAEALLMSIAVDPQRQGGGIGRKLVDAFNTEIRRRGIDCYCLTTDRDGNEPANDFYRRLGFALSRTFVTPEGRRMNEFIMRLDGGEAS